MRNLIALVACSFVIATASAIDPPATAQTTAPGAAVKAAAEPAKAAPVSIKPTGGAPLSAAAQASKDDQVEAELSAKIAARLAEMRAKQAARLVSAARAKKAAEARQREAALPAAANANVAPQPRHSNYWSYEGDTGPANWGRINSDWAKCSTGMRQSPIDLRDGMKVDLEQIAFDYHPSGFNEVDNAHTIQVAVGLGNYITVQNRTFELVQLHFHRPSEERIGGRGAEMVVHLVHKDPEGRLAVVAVLLERGAANPLIQTIWNNLPLEKNDTVTPVVALDVNEILPAKREYFTFMGSLTTPPCTEGVLWLVMKNPMQASPAQMALFSRLYPMNARPVQPSGGRIIKESN